MVDDFGHECVESYGGTSYATPQLTRMATAGAQFNHAHAQNICTPSRVQIMTGQYNVRNYTRFATFDQSQRTFGHAFKDAGYVTGIVGKWQLVAMQKRFIHWALMSIAFGISEVLRKSDM